MNIIIDRTWKQGSLVNIEDLRGLTFQAEAQAHTFRISGVDAAGNPITLTGTPSGVMLRPDNTDVALTCAVSDGKVTATLPAECYDVPGRVGIAIYLTSNSQKVCIYSAITSVNRTSSGTASPGTTSSVVDLVNAINAAISSIPASYSNLLADIAPTYSDSALYAVGQYAWYDGDLKRCIVPITTSESYTAAHWTSAVLGQDVCDLKSALGFVFRGTKYATISNTTVFSDADNAPVNTIFAINNTSGTNISHLPSQTGTLMTFSYKDSGNANFDVQMFFATNGDMYTRAKFSGSWKSWTKKTTSAETEKVFLGKKYAIVSDTTVFADADNAPVNTIFAINNTSGTDIDHLPGQIGTLFSFSYSDNSNVNFNVQFFFKDNGDAYIREKFSSAWKAWAKIATDSDISTLMNNLSAVFLGTKYALITNTSVLSDANTAPVNTVFAILNGSGTDISNIPKQTGTLISFSHSGTANSNFEIQMFCQDDGILFARSKFNSSWNEWAKINNDFSVNNVFSAIPESATTKKIYLLGDSITQGYGSTGFITYSKTVDGTTYSVRGNGPDYPSAGAGYQTGDYLYASDTRIWYEALDGNGWAQKLKQYFESKFNCTVKNYGMSGINTTGMINFLDSQTIITNADIILIKIGVNDREQKTLSEYYANMKSIVNKLKKIAKKVVVVSQIQTSITDETHNVKHFHTEDIEHICMKVADELDCCFINLRSDFLNYCWITNTTIDSLLSDGLHPNDNGYDVMFKLITSEMNLGRKQDDATW